MILKFFFIILIIGDFNEINIGIQQSGSKQSFDLPRIPVEVIPSNFDENSVNEPDPYQLVQQLALEKARVVQKFWEEDQLALEGHADHYWGRYNGSS